MTSERRLRNTQAQLAVLVLLAFALATTVIDFFHTEHSLDHRDHCPACQLHHSAAAAHVAEAPELSEPLVQRLEWVCMLQISEPLLRVHQASRSPPSA